MYKEKVAVFSTKCPNDGHKFWAPLKSVPIWTWCSHIYHRRHFPHYYSVYSTRRYSNCINRPSLMQCSPPASSDSPGVIRSICASRLGLRWRPSTMPGTNLADTSGLAPDFRDISTKKRVKYQIFSYITRQKLHLQIW